MCVCLLESTQGLLLSAAIPGSLSVDPLPLTQTLPSTATTADMLVLRGAEDKQEPSALGEG